MPRAVPPTAPWGQARIMGGRQLTLRVLWGADVSAQEASRQLDFRGLSGVAPDPWEWKPEWAWDGSFCVDWQEGQGRLGVGLGLSSTSREIFQCFHNWHGCVGEYG